MAKRRSLFACKTESQDVVLLLTFSERSVFVCKHPVGDSSNTNRVSYYGSTAVSALEKNQYTAADRQRFFTGVLLCCTYCRPGCHGHLLVDATAMKSGTAVSSQDMSESVLFVGKATSLIAVFVSVVQQYIYIYMYAYHICEPCTRDFGTAL